jgi:hypothetical protein
MVASIVAIIFSSAPSMALTSAVQKESTTCSEDAGAGQPEYAAPAV